MTTIVTNPAPAEGNGGNGFMFLIGVLVLVGFVAVLLYFGIPAVGRMMPSQVSVPAVQQITVPDKIDVNVTQPK